MGLERIVLMTNTKLCLLVFPGSVIVTLSTRKSLKTPGFSTQMNDIHERCCLHHPEWLLLLSLDCCWRGSVNNIKGLVQGGWKGLRPRVWIHCGLSVTCCLFMLPAERYLYTRNCKLLKQTMQLSRGSLVASWLSTIPVLGCSS